MLTAARVMYFLRYNFKQNCSRKRSEMSKMDRAKKLCKRSTATPKPMTDNGKPSTSRAQLELTIIKEHIVLDLLLCTLQSATTNDIGQTKFGPL